MVVDVCTFNGEYDLWDIHYHSLKGVVDEFIIVEAQTTFSGLPKPLYSLATGVYYNPIPTWPKVSVWIVDENYSQEELKLAEESPNTAGAEHWKTEFLQKESIKKALTHLQDDDLVFLGDVDEIWDVSALKLQFPVKLKLDVYTYYLNNRSNEQFWGTTVAPYHVIKNTCLNHLRTNAPKSKKTHGWHFTSMGGAENLRKKLTDSYTQEDYASKPILDNLEYTISHNKDFLGRDFTYSLDESNWPEYLRENRETYANWLRK